MKLEQVVVLEGFRREVTVSDLCRREGIKPGVFYCWTEEFMEARKERLTRDTTTPLMFFTIYFGLGHLANRQEIIGT